ncbi:hypothetical protein EBO34_01660 [Alteribacter keqinensis]|uniref:Uncharacterized protein n=1 Tax=Alteribacter keqinensis TaxID=2483800 RepID=A0A3M7TTZ3_9BACI|nr:hypothetical protein EBO34_01660 [Alteribacter keqinensis]
MICFYRRIVWKSRSYIQNSGGHIHALKRKDGGVLKGPKQVWIHQLPAHDEKPLTAGFIRGEQLIATE